LNSTSYDDSVNRINDDDHDNEKYRNLDETPYNSSSGNNNKNKYGKDCLEYGIEKLNTEMNDDTSKVLKKISSISPSSIHMTQTPVVINYFESITSNDYKDKSNKDKPIKSQYVQRNVHDLSKANIHQFKLKI